MPATSSEHNDSRPWYRWIELWYVAYALLGMVGLGLIRFLIPLAVARGGNAAQVGLVVAAVNVGGLTAPMWGGLADRNHWHRLLVTMGLAMAGFGLAGFVLMPDLVGLWILLALVQGIGVAAATTMGNLLVVEAHPKPEWDQRISWLQTFIMGGQTVGFLMAGFLSHIGLDLAILVAAGVAILGALIGWLTVRNPPASDHEIERQTVVRPPEGTEWGHGSTQHHFHLHVHSEEIRSAGRYIFSRFGLFLSIYGLAALGSVAIIGFFPLIMKNVYQIDSRLAAVLLTIAGITGVLFLTPSGLWAKKFGTATVLDVALALRILVGLSLVIMALLGWSPTWLLLITFIGVTGTWSAVQVSSIDLAGRLAPQQGVGMGMLSATFYLAGVLGAVLGGWAANIWGYQAPLILAAGAGVLAALLELIRRLTKPKPV